jgi:hypothetical protein
LDERLNIIFEALRKRISEDVEKQLLELDWNGRFGWRCFDNDFLLLRFPPFRWRLLVGFPARSWWHF